MALLQFMVFLLGKLSQPLIFFLAGAKMRALFNTTARVAVL